MTKISIFKIGNYYKGFIFDGHASEGDLENYVCASISTLSQTLYFTLIDKLNINEDEIRDVQDDGYLEIEIPDRNVFNRNDVQTCFEFMIKGIELIRSQYPQYLTLKVVEVQNDKIWFIAFFF